MYIQRPTTFHPFHHLHHVLLSFCDLRVVGSPPKYDFSRYCFFSWALSFRGFSSLEASAKGSLIESLCSNFGVLNPSTTALSYAALESNEDAAYMLQQIHSHRNALKIYAYFLHCILVLEEAAEPELGALRVEKAVGKVLVSMCGNLSCCGHHYLSFYSCHGI